MHIFDILEKKKNKIALSKEEITFVIDNYTNGNIPDYQMSALLMAIVLNGMNIEETTQLTIAMANSGDKMVLPFLNTVDKHSTGGVGDKTTLVVAPIVACLDCNVAKMSGRGLGYTGGTIDKLESIPGFKVQLIEAEFIQQVQDIHFALISQTKNIAPADKKIYALRDVTATVESIPLIASSIMSKKIASGAKNLVLDVKVGNGAFMKNIEDAKLLAETMVTIGENCGIKTIAVLTDMNQPLGNAIGNAIEIEEVLAILTGKGPRDLNEISIELATQMLSLTKKVEYSLAKQQVIEVLNSNQALHKFTEFIVSQNGNLEQFQQVKKSKYQYEVRSTKEGYIYSMNTEEIGKISCRLGAGRMKKEDSIDPTAGIYLQKKIGDYIHVGDIVATLYSSSLTNLEPLAKEYIHTINCCKEKQDSKKIIIDIIKSD